MAGIPPALFALSSCDLFGTRKLIEEATRAAYWGGFREGALGGALLGFVAGLLAALIVSRLASLD